LPNPTSPHIDPTARWSTGLFLLVWLLSALYVGANLNRGWVDHDEGTLGQSAERVLNGELPHRDFDDPYTGGLAYIDAHIFRLFGINLLSLRLLLFGVFLAWVPAVYAIAREFLTPLPAAGLTLVAIAWSVPNYPAAMPSWFCLFLATFGTLLLLKCIRCARTYDLFLAGLCGGFSFLVKSSGLFFVAGALLFLVYREQSLATEGLSEPRPTRYYSAFVVICLTIFCAALAKLVMPGGGISDFLHFVLPAFAISLLLTFREFRRAKIDDAARFRSLLTMIMPVFAGFGFPLLILIGWFWFHNSTRDLISGMFVLHERLGLTRLSPPPPILLLPSIILALLLTEREPRGGSRPYVAALKIPSPCCF
jgi:hypothetical protein